MNPAMFNGPKINNSLITRSKICDNYRVWLMKDYNNLKIAITLNILNLPITEDKESLFKHIDKLQREAFHAKTLIYILQGLN